MERKEDILYGSLSLTYDLLKKAEKVSFLFVIAIALKLVKEKLSEVKVRSF
ncbi:hypothetical protein QY97_01630 [Bacillus thermotolerans]|nr:hypothetical protein QY97_01630 [Bacillus thermotolerans]